MSRISELAHSHPWRWGAAWGVVAGAGVFVTDMLLGQSVGTAALQGALLGVLFGVVIAIVRRRQAKT